jgi:hypothetical protein
MAKLRDEHGKFIKGAPGISTGRPPKEREVKFYDLTVSAISDADWVAIVNKAKAQAKSGDSVARKWLADYLMGVPSQKMELTGKDGSKLNINLSWEEADD